MDKLSQTNQSMHININPATIMLVEIYKSQKKLMENVIIKILFVSSLPPSHLPLKITTNIFKRNNMKISIQQKFSLLNY